MNQEQRPQIARALCAPPLTDELLVRYRELVAGRPASPEKDAAEQLLRACEAWWELEYSPSIAKGAAYERQHVAELSPANTKALDQVIPWDHDVAAAIRLAEGVDAEASEANAKAMEAWRASVAELLRQRMIPDIVLGRVESRMLRDCMHAIGRYGAAADSFIDRLIDLFRPGSTRETLRRERDRVVEWQHAAAAECEQTTPAIPRPALQSTEFRDCMFHLAWHVRELSLGREPVTTDLLKR